MKLWTMKGKERVEVEATRLSDGRLSYISPWSGQQVIISLEGKRRPKGKTMWMRKDIEQAERRLALSRKCPERQPR